MTTAGSVPTAAAAPRTGMRARMLRGSVFEVGGYGLQQVLRLGSSLITTRLLFPAAFGLSALVFVTLTGLMMFSDLALQPCVIQSKRGDERAFLNTAFTIQAIRGLGLALIIVVLAKPLAWFYKEPQLEALLYAGSLQMVFTGLHSTSIFTLRRSLKLGWVNALDLIQTSVAIPLTILLAWLYPSPWAVVIGSLAGGLVYSAVSHLLPVPYRNRFEWDKTAVTEIRSFGRWVLGSSAASFIGAQADRILMGRFLGAAWLGVYAVALTLSEAVNVVIARVITGIMYPALAEARRHANDDVTVVANLFYRLRARLDLFTMGATGFLAGVGPWLVHLLWDARYADAAWVLRIVCVRVAIISLVSASETCLFALGQTRYVFGRSLARLLAAVALIPIGWRLGGVQGLIWATVVTEAFTALAVWPRCIVLRVFRIQRELYAVGIFAAAFAVGRLVLGLLPELHLR